jgi:hypothetical protein
MARQQNFSAAILTLEDAVAALADESVRASFGSIEGLGRRRHVRALKHRRERSPAHWVVHRFICRGVFIASRD